MRWYVNDASLQGQFLSPVHFEPAIRELVELRKTEPAYSNLFVARSFSFQKVSANQTLSHAVQTIADRDLRLRVLQWINQRGPFIDDDRLAEEDDLFECLGIEVTDQGLGEAARRILNGSAAGSWSFVGGAIDFCHNPLEVSHGLSDSPIGRYSVTNVWTADAFRAVAIASLAEPTSWADLAARLRVRFPRLLIADTFDKNSNLRAEPFNSSISDRAQELCRHLDEYMASRNPDGSPTERTNELVRTLFTGAGGAEPLFTAESQSNQDAFRSELTFPNPDDPGRNVFAHWHGKIRHRFFRMHFEWPVPGTSTQIKVLYLGPKLTKG